MGPIKGSFESCDKERKVIQSADDKDRVMFPRKGSIQFKFGTIRIAKVQ
jgi:hypothetical protein